MQIGWQKGVVYMIYKYGATTCKHTVWSLGSVLYTAILKTQAAVKGSDRQTNKREKWHVVKFLKQIQTSIAIHAKTWWVGVWVHQHGLDSYQRRDPQGKVRNARSWGGVQGQCISDSQRAVMNGSGITGHQQLGGRWSPDPLWQPAMLARPLPHSTRPPPVTSTCGKVDHRISNTKEPVYLGWYFPEGSFSMIFYWYDMIT